MTFGLDLLHAQAEEMTIKQTLASILKESRDRMDTAKAKAGQGDTKGLKGSPGVMKRVPNVMSRPHEPEEAGPEDGQGRRGQ